MSNWSQGEASIQRGEETGVHQLFETCYMKSKLYWLSVYQFKMFVVVVVTVVEYPEEEVS